MSDSSSSSSGSAKTGTLKACVDCKGTCTITAIEFIYALVWNVISTAGTCSKDIAGCCCVMPKRPPDFVGDVEITDCDCCYGCMYRYNDIERWVHDGGNLYSCLHQACHGDCNKDFPTGGPPPKINGLYQARMGTCH
jgi:hypothetical protein